MTMPNAVSGALAGTGAAFVIGALAGGANLEIWFAGVFVTDGPAPRLPPQLVGAFYLCGAFVAGRLGGRRAVGAFALYALLTMSPLVVRGVVEPALQCALSGRTCPTAPVIDELAAIGAFLVWMASGVGLGAIAGRAIRVEIPFRRGLAAISVFAIGAIVTSHLLTLVRYTVCFSSDFQRCGPQEDLLFVAAFFGQGVLAALLLARLRGRTADALVPASLLALAFAPAPLHQLGMVAGDGLLPALSFLAPLMGIGVFVLVTVAPLGRRAVVAGRLRAGA